MTLLDTERANVPVNPAPRNGRGITVPRPLKPLGTVVKLLLRKAVEWRLRHRSLSADQAAYWAEMVKQWPAILHSEGCVQKKELFPGFVMNLGIVDVIERTLRTEGKWDNKVARVLEHYLGKGDTFIDAGANIGYFSLYASTLVGQHGHVIAIEPSRRALEKLIGHVRINRFSNISVVSCGLSEKSGKAVLNLATPNNIGASSLRPLEAVGSEIVLMLRLDDILGESGVVPKLVKVDVEGYELYALKGMSRLLATARPNVVSELDKSFLAALDLRVDDVIDYMAQFGYACFYLGDGDALEAVRITSGAALPNSAEVLFSVSEPAFVAT